jgi:hypothetical protein
MHVPPGFMDSSGVPRACDTSFVIGDVVVAAERASP